jgi:hypothetical protein
MTKSAPTLHPELAGAVREVLGRASQPLNLAKLRGQLNGPFKVPAKLKDALAALLEAESREGRIYAWPASTEKSGPRYWIRDGRDWAAREMIAAAASLEPIGGSKAIGAVAKQYGRKPAEKLLVDLIESGLLIRVPLFGGSKAKISSYIADEAAFRAELDAARRVIEAGYRRLETGDAGPLPDGPGSESAGAPDQILEALASLEPRKGLLVTAPRLYRALPPDLRKSEIDAALIRLQNDRRVILHLHSNPQSLPAGERQSLIEDATGNFYVGVSWRITED